jgi:hypothetical protein
MKTQLKLLKEFAPLLKQFMEPDEEILLAVKAASPMSFLEQLITGWIIYYIKRCVLVFTNKRILHFPTNANFRPKQSVAQARYGDIERFKLSGFLSKIFKVVYKNGKKENFYYIRSTEFKKLKTLLPLFIKDGQPSEIMQRHHLCPNCIIPLPRDRFTCPNCRLEFKNVTQAIRSSILFPGGGYFYTRHSILGISDAIVETILSIALIVSLIDASKGTEPWSTVMLIAVILFVEKIITIYHTKHFVSEYIPVNKDFVPIKRI